jgi:hypothetical protein
VEVDVKYSLTRVRVAIEHRAVAAVGVPFLFGDCCRATNHLADKVIVTRP